MKAIVCEHYGEPSEVLQVRDLPSAEPGPGQVRVRMLASPINPSDLLFVRGSYGPRGKLPVTPGFEGVGVIDAVGPGLLKHLRGLRVGRRVGVLRGTTGNWRQSVVLPARFAVPIPDDIPTEQAASFFVNPATVVAMVERVLDVRAGAWLLQTAAAGALGKMVIRLGKHRGFHTINLVRRPEQADELRTLGADEAIATNQENAAEKLATLTKGQGVPFALDAVGGAMGRLAVESLGTGGRLLVYGTLSDEPIPIEPRTLIGGQKSVAGFWLSLWADAQRPLAMLSLFREIFALMRAGVFVTDIAAKCPLDDIQSAVREAERAGRAGKVLLICGD